MEQTKSDDKRFCECGCGEEIVNRFYIFYRKKIEKRFIHGHNPKPNNTGRHNSPTTEFKKGQNVGNRNWCWKGGRKRSPQGYVLVRCEGHPMAIHRGYYVYEHRLVMEKYLERYLSDEEVIHHINGNRTDNRIENLRLFESHSEHMKFEAELKRT